MTRCNQDARRSVGWKRLGWVAVLLASPGATTGCSWLTTRPDPPAPSARQDWVAPLRGDSAVTDDAPEHSENKTPADSIFFNAKSREIEKSLGL